MESKEVSIYEAEIRGKPRTQIVEDQLTSRVFGALSMLPPEIVLLPFLRQLAEGKAPSSETDRVLARVASWKPSDVELLQIHLWEYIDNTCPDVCIMTPSTLLVIEAKKDSEPDKEKQLKPQFRDARKKAQDTGRELAYFLLTKVDRSALAWRAQEELRGEFRDADIRIHWRSWTQVWEWLRNVKRESLGKTGKDTQLNLLEATLRLLEGKNMSIKGPTGFKAKWFGNDVITALENVEELCDEIGATINSVTREARLRGLEVVGDTPHKKSVLRKLSAPADWVQRYFEFYFRDAEWKLVKDPWKDPSLFISFGLEAGSAGIQVGLYWHCRLEESVIDEIREHANQKGFDPAYSGDELYVYNYRDSSLVGMETGEQAVKTLVERLEEMRSFANELGVLRKALGHKTRRNRSS